MAHHPSTAHHPPTILNAFKGTELDVTELVDHDRIQFYVENMAEQINNSRNHFAGKLAAPSKTVRDLSRFIAEILIETSVQGASFIEVHIIDPAWVLFKRDTQGNCFIDTDDSGYLWPPIEVNFPPSVTDSRWRLCQCRPSTDLNQANVILTFEDLAAARLRESSGPKASADKQTRAEFIQFLIHDANRNPEYPGEPHLRFISLLEPGAFQASDLSLAGPTPASALQPNAPSARKDHTKGIAVSPIPIKFPGASPVAQTVGDQVISIADGLQSVGHTVTDPSDVNWDRHLPVPLPFAH